MNQKVVIFDFDGTIADTFNWFVTTINEIADKYKFKRFDSHNADALRLLDINQIISLHKIPRWKMPFIVKDMQYLMKRDADKITLFPSMEYTLRELVGAGFTLAIVTSNSRGNVMDILGKHRVEIFTHIECSSIFGKKKKLKKLLSKFDIPPESTIFIGDEVRDAIASLETRIPFGAVTWGYNHIDLLNACQAKEIFTHPREIIKKLNRMTD